MEHPNSNQQPDDEYLRKADIDTAFEKWVKAPQELASLSSLYYAMRAVLGRAENPSSFPDEHPLVAYAASKLVEATRGVTSLCGEELEVDTILLLNIILHNRHWKYFLGSSADKRLLAALFCSFSPVEESVMYARICAAVTEWSSEPFNPGIKQWEKAVMERFFGIGWMHLYYDEVKGNAHAKFATLGSLMAPIIFETPNKPVTQELPTDMSSFT